MSPAEVADLLESSGRAIASTLDALPPEVATWHPEPGQWCVNDLARGGMHPEVGRLTVDEVLHEWVHHDGNHLKQALGNVQAYVWSRMGNAQRFSQPAE